jgi:hypothetical protein
MTRQHATQPHDATAARPQPDPAGASQHPLLALQQQLGNALIARMLAQRAAAQEQDGAPEVGLEGGPVSDATAAQINSKRGGGASLDGGVRASMEQSFGTSFEGVRVHTDSASHQLNRSLGARAFTTGSDIFFGQGASASDQGLVAHELTHVVQQRSMSAGGAMTVGAAGDSSEREAESVAAAVTSATGQAQRTPDEE